MFQKAVDRHNLLMKKGMENAGCDRHLFGLNVEAMEDAKFNSLPEIFTDSAFTKRLVTDRSGTKLFNVILEFKSSLIFDIELFLKDIN